jgi:hypothetical protein
MAVFGVVVPCSLPPSSGLIALMMEAANTSETSVNFTRLHDATTQKTAIFILAAVRTCKLTLQQSVFMPRV